MLSQIFRRISSSIAMRHGRHRPLESYFDLWSGSDAVYIGPVSFGAKLRAEAAAIEEIVRDREISEADLARAVEHSDPKIAAYAVESLCRRIKPRLPDLKREAIERKEEVVICLGCTRHTWGLAEWIKFRAIKAAQPGATDNPDDAQRLREDH